MADVYEPTVIFSDDESDYSDDESDYNDSSYGDLDPPIDENLLRSNVKTGHAACRDENDDSGFAASLKSDAKGFPITRRAHLGYKIVLTQQLQLYVPQRSPLPHAPLFCQTSPQPSSASARPLVGQV